MGDHNIKKLFWPKNQSKKTTATQHQPPSTKTLPSSTTSASGKTILPTLQKVVAPRSRTTPSSNNNSSTSTTKLPTLQKVFARRRP
ncbi:hypothetical protein SESBI_34962 [Sesbania bispinosa]|nr:hypothetical protein SESBI_34962 [Sesbania bispinosa]